MPLGTYRAEEESAIAELWPNIPRPSMVSAPEIVDPHLEYVVDQGYKVRRSRWSRPRRRWMLEYLGLDTYNMHILRDYVFRHRLGTLDFAWIHPTAVDVATMIQTTPVALFYLHGLFTGAWVFVTNGPNPSLNGGFFQVTLQEQNVLLLNNTTPSGPNGPCQVQVYVPHVLIVGSNEDAMAAPATLIGPEQLPYAPAAQRTGFFNWQVTLEEIF